MFLYEDGRYRDLDLLLANHTYRGRSVGSEQTCHQFPGLNMMFDVGGAPLSSTAVPNVFITHAHNDHIGGLCSHHQRRSGRALEPARYFVQEGDVEPARAMVEATRVLNRSQSLLSLTVTPIGMGSEVPVGGGLTVRPFRSTHTLPCLGYALWGTRKRLKAEYRGAGRDVLVAAKKRGEAIDEEFSIPEIAFPGDTNLTLLERDAGDVVRNARVLLLECTFIDDEVSPRDAFKGGHVHLEAFIDAARARAFKNEVILLTHFSARYHPEYVRETLNRRLGNEDIASRVQLLLPPARN